MTTTGIPDDYEFCRKKGYCIELQIESIDGMLESTIYTINLNELHVRSPPHTTQMRYQGWAL